MKHPVVRQSTANTAAAAVDDSDDNDDTSQFDVTATYFQHLLLTNVE